MTQRTLGLTVATLRACDFIAKPAVFSLNLTLKTVSIRRFLGIYSQALSIVVHALLRRHFFDTFLPVWFEVVHFRFEVPAEGVWRVDFCRPRLQDLLL